MKIKNIVIGVQAERYESCVEFMKLAKEAETDTVIVTRADGARIMMIKTPFGEMSVELSKPDDSMAHGEMISKGDPDDFQSDSSAFSLAATESSQK